MYLGLHQVYQNFLWALAFHHQSKELWNSPAKEFIKARLLHDLSPHMSSQPITSRIYQRLLCLLTNQIAHQGFWIFNWLTLPLDWRWLPHRLSKRQSLTTVLLRTRITRMIFFNQGMLVLGSNHFLKARLLLHVNSCYTPCYLSFGRVMYECFTASYTAKLLIIVKHINFKHCMKFAL